MKPGRRVASPRSMTVALGGIWPPTNWILSPETTTTPGCALNLNEQPGIAQRVDWDHGRTGTNVAESRPTRASLLSPPADVSDEHARAHAIFECCARLLPHPFAIANNLNRLSIGIFLAD